MRNTKPQNRDTIHKTDLLKNKTIFKPEKQNWTQTFYIFNTQNRNMALTDVPQRRKTICLSNI